MRPGITVAIAAGLAAIGWAVLRGTDDPVKRAEYREYATAWKQREAARDERRAAQKRAMSSANQ